MTLVCRYNLNLSLLAWLSAYVGLGIANVRQSAPVSSARRELTAAAVRVERVDRTEAVKYRATLSVLLGVFNRVWITLLICG